MLGKGPATGDGEMRGSDSAPVSRLLLREMYVKAGEMRGSDSAPVSRLLLREMYVKAGEVQGLCRAHEAKWML